MIAGEGSLLRNDMLDPASKFDWDLVLLCDMTSFVGEINIFVRSWWDVAYGVSDMCRVEASPPSYKDLDDMSGIFATEP